jgi:hypothetical protein
MQKNKVPVLSIVFYVLAVLLLAYAIWAATYSINYVSKAIEQNQLIVEGYEFEIASFYMTNIAQYVVFAAILFGIGWILQKLDAGTTIEFEDDEESYSEDMWLEEEEEEAEGAEETPHTD